MAAKKDKAATAAKVEKPAKAATTTAAKVEKPAKPKIEKIQANGVTRPKDGTKTGSVWAISDKISEKTGAPATRADVMAECLKKEINEATTSTQYGRWRKFHGLERTAKVAVAKTTKKPKKDAAAPAAAA